MNKLNKNRFFLKFIIKEKQANLLGVKEELNFFNQNLLVLMQAFFHSPLNFENNLTKEN